MENRLFFLTLAKQNSASYFFTPSSQKNRSLNIVKSVKANETPAKISVSQ